MADSSHRTGVIVRGLACGGGARVLAVVAHGPAREVCERHELSAGAAVLAAEGLVVTALQTAALKGDEVVTVRVQGEEPRFSLMAEVREDGSLRARFRPSVLGSERAFSGLFLTIKSLDRKELYRSLAEVRSETFGDALERYARDSAQVDARVRVLARLGEDGLPVFAAGLLVERLPHFPPAAFTQALGAALDGDIEELMTGFAFGKLAGSPVEVLETRDLVHRCTCSRARMAEVLGQLGAADLRALLAERGGAEISCDFCREVRQWDADELTALIAALEAAARGDSLAVASDEVDES